MGVLGPLMVQLQDGPISVSGQRQRDLLSVLVLRRAIPVSPEVLLDLVWRGQRGLTGSVVHTAVARLRRLCGAVAVERREAGYLVARNTTTDADSFNDLVQSARRTQRRNDPGTACALYRAALAQRRGPQPFEGVAAHLVDPDRTRLLELRVAAQQELAELLLAHPETGDAGEAGASAAAVMREDRLREGGHELATLAACGGADRSTPIGKVPRCYWVSAASSPSRMTRQPRRCSAGHGN